MIEQANAETRQMLDRAQAEIERERDRAIAELRREAVELAIRGASKVIEKNVDDKTNRKIVEDFLGSIDDDEAELMREPTVARNYADVLVTLATQAKDLDGWGKMMDEVAEAVLLERAAAPLPRVAARHRRREEPHHRPGLRRPAARQARRLPARRGHAPPAASAQRDRHRVPQPRWT